jgi:N-acyl amino acid synthase of PEP-CTERM/exosortase system
MFEAIHADTPALRRSAFRLRYQVYCVEHSFEEPEANPDGLESDEYDDHAVLGIVSHRETGITVGTVRLVLHKRGSDHGSLPIHRVCQHPLIRGDLLPLETTCELSRFAVSKEYRRRVHDEYQSDEHPRRGSLREMPHIALGLIAVALRMGIASGVDTVCAIMEPALLRLVARLGFHFEPLGPLILYHGVRQPCYARVKTLIDGVEAEHPRIWEAITDEGRILARTCQESCDTQIRALRPINIGITTLDRSFSPSFLEEVA